MLGLRECKPLPLQQSGDNRTPGPPLAHYTSVARVYDYLLGGKDNFAADREAAEQAMLINPSVVPSARANRAFLARAIRYLTGEAGLCQFLDIGTGMSASSNIHEVAQSVAPQARVVYADHDRVPDWRPAMAIDAKAPGQMWAGVALKPAPKPALKPK
jgi:hypothetical protein